jgi:MFS family permease
MTGAQPSSEGQVPVPAPAPVAQPVMPPMRVLLYALASWTIGLTQGFGANLVTANLQAVQANFGATANEAAWLAAAYSSTSITASLLVFKFRTQFGLRIFVELGLALFVAVSIANFLADDLRTAVVVRAVAGFAAAPLGTLAFLYMLEALPPQHKLTIGVTLGLMGAQAAVPLARLISPHLLEIGLWHHLHLLELALSLVCMAIMYLLPLTPPPRAKVFDRVDAISLPLLVLGLGLLSVVFSLGRHYWWLEAPWLGICLAVGIAALAMLVAIELNRAQPLVDLHWISSADMLVFGGSMFLARFVLSEQTTGAIGFFQNLGLLNEHMTGLLWVILGATLAGFVVSAFVNRPGRTAAIHAAALCMIALGAWLESHSTGLTRPQDVYLPQALVAFGGTIFLPAALTWSFAHTLRSGMQYFTSFFAVFLASQNLGGLIGSSMLGTLVTVREKFHSNQIVENLILSDPMVAQRIQQYGATYSHVLGDMTLRNAQGSVMLGQTATREAYVLAYNDLFLTVAVVSALCLLALITHVLVRKFRQRAAQSQTQPA